VHQSAHVLQPSKLQHGLDEVNGCVPLLPRRCCSAAQAAAKKELRITTERVMDSISEL
jgi:hypothetical protein